MPAIFHSHQCTTEEQTKRSLRHRLPPKKPPSTHLAQQFHIKISGVNHAFGQALYPTGGFSTKKTRKIPQRNYPSSGNFDGACDELED